MGDEALLGCPPVQEKRRWLDTGRRFRIARETQRNCRVLIGGYGMGFTLRAALAGLGADAQVLVAELVPAVMTWARGPMAELTAGCLDDPRVIIHEADVGGLIASARASFDAILLDVDNGPDGLSRSANDRLYDRRGLDAARQALRPNGLLAVWSAAPSKTFANRLAQAGFAVEEIKARANKGRGVRHIIWAATNPGSSRSQGPVQNRQIKP